MKIKTFSIGYPNKKPNECNHEWREYGTRLEEEVFIPIRTSPRTKLSGRVICDKCGWQPYVEEYKIIGKREYFPFGKNDKEGKEFYIDWYDRMVDIIEWGREKVPTEPVLNEFAYAELSWWEKLRNKLNI